MPYEQPSSKQKKRLEKFLAKDEKTILVTTIGRRYFWVLLTFYFFIPAILTYAPLFNFAGFYELPQFPWFKYIAIPGAIVLIYNIPKYSHLIRQRQSYTYALTNKRFIIIRGIFSRKIVTAPLSAITHVTVEQSFLQRYLYNTGHLVVITAGFDQREIVIENIQDPVQFKIMIEEITDQLDNDDESESNELRALS